MDIDEAYTLIENALDQGRPAHGYLIVGDVRGEALRLTERVLERLFGPEHVQDRAHPDIHWLLPESKSRVIPVDVMRERLVDPMAETSFSGGWKAGVLMSADRMEQASANAFLKTLEEPPSKTIFFLLTDSPDGILPTIVSRCQRIDVSRFVVRGLKDPWLGRVLTILSSAKLSSVTAKAAAAARLCGILAELKEKATALVDEELGAQDEGPGEEITDKQYDALVESRYREFRTDFTFTLMNWFRDLVAVRMGGAEMPLHNPDYKALIRERAERLTRTQAFRNVTAVEDLVLSFKRNMKEETVLFAFTDRVNFGTEAT